NIGLEDIFKKVTYRFDNINKNMQLCLIEENWKKITAIDIPINYIHLLFSCLNIKGQKSESQRMPFGIKRVNKEKSIILYCCNREKLSEPEDTTTTNQDQNQNLPLPLPKERIFD
ncbi:2315_t:CDS:2, partial [Cetraspora pellucida]